MSYKQFKALSELASAIELRFEFEIVEKTSKQNRCKESLFLIGKGKSRRRDEHKRPTKHQT
ncbi:MAG TPA: hypothetical protein DCW60_02120 [Sutterella sp.]|nr:hypothetical protein [Sutterella sp.]